MERVANSFCFGGEQLRYKHQSTSLNCEMHFSLYLPHQLAAGTATQSLRFPVVYWLSGLTSTDENFMQKAGAQRVASELGLILVAPDTSPRGEGVPDDPDGAYDFGLGAGFYLNATRAPWRDNYRMYDYVTQELPDLINTHFPADADRCAISGHSMGGHGALTVALKNPQRFRSVSAFAPIVAPMQCPWGMKAFTHYLGEDQSTWRDYDAVALMQAGPRPLPMLIDQGAADQFLEEQLKPALFIEACSAVGYPVQYNWRPGYDHGYFFIASFIEDHLRFHAQYLR